MDAQAGPIYALGLGDNSISLVSAVSGQVERVVRGVSAAEAGGLALGKAHSFVAYSAFGMSYLCLAHTLKTRDAAPKRRASTSSSKKKQRPRGFVFEPRRRLAVLNGRAGMVRLSSCIATI